MLKRLLSINNKIDSVSGGKESEPTIDTGIISDRNNIRDNDKKIRRSLDLSYLSVRNLSISLPSDINLKNYTTKAYSNKRKNKAKSTIKAKRNSSLPFGDGSTKIFGLENFSNTCYVNSILQCLYQSKEFRTNILKYPVHFDKYRKIKFKCEPCFNRYFSEESFVSKISKIESTNSSIDKDKKKIKLNISDNIPSTNNESKGTNFQLSKKYSTDSNNTLSSKNKASKNPEKDREKAELVFKVISHIDPFVEFLHSQSTCTIVGRSNLIDSIVLNKLLARKKDDTPKCNFSDNNSNSNLSMSFDSLIKTENNEIEKPFTTEQKRKIALVAGPILNIDHMLDKTMEKTLYSSLKDIFECINENERLTGVVSPIQFLHLLKKKNAIFRTRSQQDAHEFLNFLLNDLNEDLLDMDRHIIPKSYTNFIMGQFQGLVTCHTKCLKCNNDTQHDEKFIDLAIELNDDSYCPDSIQDILGDYVEKELLTNDNKYFCSNCNELQDAERYENFKKLPPTLSLQLKRFKYSEAEQSNVKLFTKIKYPLTLNVGLRNDGKLIEKKYQLTSLVVHVGGGPYHGHYISICKNEHYGWLFFDDEIVEAISEETVLQFVGGENQEATAYLLFYNEIKVNDDDTSDVVNEMSQFGDCSKDNLDRLIENDNLSAIKESKGSFLQWYG